MPSKHYRAGVLAALAAWFTASAAQAQAIEWSPYKYELKSGTTIAAELGRLDVPLHHGRAGSGTLTLRFVRIPAEQPNIGSPIVYLAGGPGSSGIDAGRGDRWPLFDMLRKQGDVILLDQRGVGLSSPPPACSTPWAFPNDQASTERTFNASLEAAASRCASEWRKAGVDLSVYNTAENAADVADLARGLGGHVRVVGISYGTFLALAVLRDHAGLVDKVVLAGTEGPDNTLKLPTQAHTVLERLSLRIAAIPAGAKLTPDLKHSVETVLARLNAAPALAEVPGSDGTSTRMLISKYDVQMLTAFLMATTPNAGRLPQLFSSMEKGDYSGAAKTVLGLRRFFAPLPAMPLAMDAASPVSAARQRSARALVTKSLFGNAVNAPSADFARALGIQPLPARWYSPVRTTTPAYFISGDLDSRTPPENAQDARRGFATSAHLVLEGAGHDNDLFLSSPAIVLRIGGFLRGEPTTDEVLRVDALKVE